MYWVKFQTISRFGNEYLIREAIFRGDSKEKAMERAKEKLGKNVRVLGASPVFPWGLDEDQ